MKSKLITSCNPPLFADKSGCCRGELFALVSDDVQNDVLHVLLMLHGYEYRPTDAIVLKFH